MSEIAIELELEQPEVYAHSLSTLRKLGGLAVAELTDVEQLQAVEDLAFDDFSTAVTEMLKTDVEFRETLDINNSRVHMVIDGKARARDGEAMVSILQTGADSSAHKAEHDPRYRGQATRDLCDVEIAERADELRPGETLWGVSHEPTQDLKDYPDVYKELGYKEGLIYIQTYSRTEDNTLVASSFSIDGDNNELLKKLLAENGMHIPDGESDNTWLRHAVVTSMTAEQAKDFVQNLRATYYKRQGKQATRSITEYAEANSDKLQYFFDAYYPPLAEAIFTGRNNTVMQEFARTIQSLNLNLKPAIRSQLMHIANSAFFTNEDGIVTDSLIRYAVAEEMRKGIAANRLDAKPIYMPNATDNNSSDFYVSPHVLLAQNIQAGVEARRSYGGCPGNIELSADGSNGEGNNTSPQEAYGGKDGLEGKENWEWKKGICQVKSCKTRPGKTEVGPCSICRSCQEKFDKGLDPTKLETGATETSAKVLLFEKKRVSDEQPAAKQELAAA